MTIDTGLKRLVLVVDDDDQLRDAISDAVSRLGVSVDTAKNGLEGYQMATDKSYDLIISDMRMPELDGKSMFFKLKEDGVSSPVCFMTAYGAVDDAVECMKFGAYDYLLKPFESDAIEKLVERTIELNEHKKKTAPQQNQSGAIYSNVNMERIYSIASEVANSEATVLITGESGTGKEVLAKHIHSSSPRAKARFVTLNCAALPENLIESELFGHEKGAFTGAINAKPGKFELADKGTILLDEIGEIPLHLQAKLLRVLQEKEIERVGGVKTIKTDVRIIATTNRDLRKMSEQGDFREDLYYRLNVINVELPPLRDRKDDIPHLVKMFIQKYSYMNKKEVFEIDNDALEMLCTYDFPGNIRELEHTMERSVILSKSKTIGKNDLFLHGISCNVRPTTSSQNNSLQKGNENNKSLQEVEQELILSTLAKTDGNKTKTAEILGITVRTVRNKLQEYDRSGVDVSKFDRKSNS